MALSGYQIKEIQRVLLNGYDDEHLEMMVRLELDQELSAIAGGNTRTLRIYTLILWAERTGRVKELVQKAHEYNPGNEQLAELVTLVHEWLEPAVIPVQGEFLESVAQAISTPPELSRQPFEPEMVLIPAGYFLMGSDPTKDEDAYDREFPQHSIYLPGYYIGKTPITNYLYWVFVNATRHKAPAHWEDGILPKDKAAHPVVNVDWHDTIAYCEWLSSAAGRAYRLPTEAEWEKAARGSDGRIYPWGNDLPTDKHCNFNEDFEDTTPVGSYPDGASPYGVREMAGNAWEWTNSIWGNDPANPDFGYPYDPDDGRENLKSVAYRIVRGGGWNAPDFIVRCAARHWGGPYGYRNSRGFRVAISSSDS